MHTYTTGISVVVLALILQVGYSTPVSVSIPDTGISVGASLNNKNIALKSSQG